MTDPPKNGRVFSSCQTALPSNEKYGGRTLRRRPRRVLRRRVRFPGAGGGRPEAPAPKNFSQGHPKVKFSKISKNPKNPKNFFSATLNIFSRSSKVKFFKSSKKHRGACRTSSATLKTTLKVTQGQIFQKFQKSPKTPKTFLRDLENFLKVKFLNRRAMTSKVL